MKKIILTLTTFLGCVFFAAAQERTTLIDSNDDVQDKIQQEPPRDNQRAIERNAKRVAEEKERKNKQKETQKDKKVNKDLLEPETKQHKEKLSVPK